MQARRILVFSQHLADQRPFDIAAFDDVLHPPVQFPEGCSEYVLVGAEQLVSHSLVVGENRAEAHRENRYDLGASVENLLVGGQILRRSKRTFCRNIADQRSDITAADDTDFTWRFANTRKLSVQLDVAREYPVHICERVLWRFAPWC